MKFLLLAALARAPRPLSRPSRFRPRMGVNLAGAEFGDQLPGVYDKQYTYPPAQSLDYYAAQKRTVIRLPFKWERVQRSPGAPLDADEVGRLRSVLRAASERKIDVILDVHNYGRYHFAGEKQSQIIGAGRISPADFADFWGKLARAFKDEPALYGYGLMNEPHDMGDAELGRVPRRPPSRRFAKWTPKRRLSWRAITEAARATGRKTPTRSCPTNCAIPPVIWFTKRTATSTKTVRANTKRATRTSKARPMLVSNAPARLSSGAALIKCAASWASLA